MDVPWTSRALVGGVLLGVPLLALGIALSFRLAIAAGARRPRRQRPSPWVYVLAGLAAALGGGIVLGALS